MALKTTITDGGGSRRAAKVTADQSLLVTQSPFPPTGEQRVIPFRQYMTTDGLPSGSNDMQVVGTLAAPVKFYVQASSESDRYITQISFLIADAGAQANKFGNITELTNGCKFYYERFDRVVTFHDALKTNFDFSRMCIFNPPLGATTSAFLVSNVISTSEAWLTTLDLTQIMPPYGLKLDAGTIQRLILEVRDDTTGVDGFDVICYGFDRLLT